VTFPTIAVERPKPVLRGVFHQWACIVAIPLGIALGLSADSAAERASAIAFSAAVTAMFGTSALYHRPTWTPRARRVLRRLDHAMIYLLIAGTYTPFALLTLDGAWRTSILAVVWSGALAAIVLKVFWCDAPTWVAASIGLALGWAGVPVLPQIVSRIGPVGSTLLLLGGLAYSAGAVIYARKRPDPAPRFFGYHEIFHLLVIVAVACQYAAVAFFLLPRV
jgi:hemolysin III